MIAEDLETEEAEFEPKRGGSLFKEMLAWLFLTGFVLFLFMSFAPHLVQSSGQTLRIGLVGPMSGPQADKGQAMVAGARLALERANAAGGADDRRIELVVRDDKGEPATAAALAKELADQTDVLAVLGHLGDAASASAGAVYAEKGLAAVTGSGGTPAVTDSNEWYFRVGLTTALQGTILANYIARILKEERVIIIHDTEAYGRSVFEALENELSIMKRRGLASVEIASIHNFSSADPDHRIVLNGIAAKLKESYSKEMIFLAVDEAAAASLIPEMKNNPRYRFGNPIPYRIMGPDSFSRPGLLEAFSTLRRERQNPGFYSEGVYAVVPFLADVANQKAQDFRRQFRADFDRAPDAVAAGCHDAATVVAQALRRLDGVPENLAVARQEVRAHLAGFDGEDKSVAGVTGNVYVDRGGNAVKAVSVGVYHERRLVSPSRQLSTVASVEALNSNAVLQIKGGYFTRTQIVHTGLAVNEIRDVDLENRRALVDLNIWFRHHGDLDMKAIEFPNAVEPVRLGQPIDRTSVGDTHYRLFRVKGVFKTDFTPGEAGFGRRILGLQVRHGELNRERLILVPDLLGMARSGEGSLTERVKQRTILSDGADWAVERADTYLDTEPVSTLGNPKFTKGDVAGHSRINLVIRLKPTDLTMRGLIDFELALRVFLICGVAIAILTIATCRIGGAPDLK